MNRCSFLFFACFGASLLLLNACGNEGSSPRETVEEINIEKVIDGDAEPGLMHVVYFWLNEGLTLAETEDFVKGVWSLEAVPSVKRMFVGTPASTPSRGVVDNSFDYALMIYFDDVEGHDAYQVHPIHLKFVEQHEEKFKTVQVKDNVLIER